MINITKKLQNQRFIKTKNKIPLEKDWVKRNNYLYTDLNFIKFLNNNSTYGVLCGYNNLIVIDIDKKEIQEELLLNYDIFSKTFTVKTAGKGLFHFYFYTNKLPESFKCLDKDLNTLLDAQGQGKQVIGPGSILENKKEYEIVNDFDILEVDYDYLRKILIRFDKQKEKNEEEKEQKNYSEDPILGEIKEKISIRKILNENNINVNKNPTDCPFHSSKGGKCFSFTQKLWHCFHCEKKGDVFTLYMKLNNCDFIEAKNKLLEACDINKKEESKKEKKVILGDYKDINIKKFIIYKSEDETIYKIFIDDFYITLEPDTILGAGDFRKKYFNETGYLFKSLPVNNWVDLVNDWIEKYGTIIDQKEVTTTNIIKETIINDIQNFAIVTEPIEALSYGRLLYIKDEPGYIYVCNKALNSIIKKNQFKITMSKLKVLLDDYIVGNSKVIRTGKSLNRFFKMTLTMLPIINIDDIINKTEDVEDDENN